MKNCYALFFSLLLCNMLSAQFNMTFKSLVSYNENLNDVWGYAAPDGREYALVGLRGGVSVVEVTDAENPEIKGYAPGPLSTWRDIKTFGTYAYVTNDNSGGLLVIDLTNLPTPLTEDDYYYWAPNIPDLGDLNSCHNIFIDEFGYAYLVGCDINTGGPLFVDVFTNPGTPEYVAAAPPIYSHDIYVRENIAYSSEIYEGEFTVYDVTDKFNPVALGGHATPFDFTHNAWLSDDSNFIFTTDELENAPVAAYDISNLNNIQEIDQFRPLMTLGEGVKPHNVHVWNDWLIISYYTDGCILVDGARPHNLIEVGNFDTFLPSDQAIGAWGAYPFLPSGIVLVTDVGNGFFILEPNYVRACYLEGNVTDFNTGADISNVSIEILTDELNESTTSLQGGYATGLAISGIYDVIFSHPDYQSVTASVFLENGVVTILDVQLGTSSSVAGQVISEISGEGIPFAEVFVQGSSVDYEITTDANGNFALNSVFVGDYNIYASLWGHTAGSSSVALGLVPENILIEINDGYKDDFIVNLGWEVVSTTSSGEWERGEPIGTYQNNGATIVNPEVDVEDDLGNLCYITGNDGGGIGEDDVDNGFTQLISPPMELANYNSPVLKFNYWFFNGGGNGSPNDVLTVTVDNGTESVLLVTYNTSASAWNEVELNLAGVLTLTDNMRITFETSDQVGDNNGHVVEAGIDAFEVYDAGPTAASDLDNNLADLTALPNPFSNTLTVNYQFEAIPSQAVLHIYNLLGQAVEHIQLDNYGGSLEINSIREKGIYFLQIEADGRLMKATRVVKH